MKSFCLILLALIFTASCQAPPPWGGNPRFSVKVKMGTKDATWNFTYYYDWILKVQRFEHESAQEDDTCLIPQTNFKKNGIPCVVTSATDTWTYIAFPTHDYCCRCNRKAIPIYEWLKDSGSYSGIEAIDGMSVTHWITKGPYYLSHYYSTVDKQFPVRFLETKNQVSKSWDFDLTTYTTGPIDPDKTKPQCNTDCPGYCSKMAQEQEMNLQTE